MPYIAVAPASAARGSVVSIKISNCPLDGPGAGEGLFFHDSANLRAPSGPGRESGLYQLTFDPPNAVIRWTTPSTTSLGVGQFYLLCHGNSAHTTLLVQ